ncbi:MAG TPA: extracellular solute-binding protein [Stellaceae bacterium]|nr:extracellular solute-binding protein [Stellaceae bacterium]
MRTLLGIAALIALIASPALAAEGDLCAQPKEVQGFKTCADVAKAEAEGELVVYATNPEAAELRVLAEFNKLFPKVKTNYTRLQAGALYAKLNAERQASTYTVDLIQISDMGMILDFQKKNGFERYASPQLASYKPEYKSQPEGLWTWGAIGPAGLAYNTSVTPADQAPKTWAEAIDPKWTDAINVKLSTSGLQHVAWFELRRLYGPDYWKKFGELKPKGFDSYVQQFDRLVNQQDKLIHTAQYSGYLEWKKKGAPIGFVAPADGLPATPESWGIPTKEPHPNAARLYLDWFLSDLGQKAMSDNLFLHSPRAGAAPPPGGEPLDKLKLLMPADWETFLKSRTEFAKEWDRYTGLR